MRSVKRLYAELKPSHYALQLTPDIKAMVFTGSVAVRLRKTGRPSQRITFHQNGLIIDKAVITKLEKKGNRELPVVRINNQNTLHEVRLHTAEMVYSGDYEVHMEFHGAITRGMTGLYPCYFTVDSTEHVMLATQFESHHARELFPCIDEPEAKATFDLALVSPKDMTVLANTPARTSIPHGKGLVETTFETSPKMSTYLLAFVIGELHGKHTKTKRGTEVAAWATIAQPADTLDYALDVGKRSIEYFEDYFGVPYPLPKADHVALPDFTSGAMENWGLITYRERVMLAYPDASQSVKESIALTIAHETSHQWFGNLVTMRWWDNLWLNESFANMMEYEAVDALFPEWHIWDLFASSEALSSLRRDAISGVQSVQVKVRHPDEISTLFDPSIVYAKGGRLLNMLRVFIGDEAFRKGLRAYFTKHAYGNTTGNDLWLALSETSGRDIAAFMEPWLERPGFPVVSIDQNGLELVLTQTHFLESGQESDGRVWPVPLFSSRTELPPVFDKPALHRRLKDESPLLINQGFAGHYIVNYARPEHREHIVRLIDDQQLDVPDRIMLLNGASMLAKAGYQPFSDTLQLLAAYRNEQVESVWSIIVLILGEARRFADFDDKLEERIKAFIRPLIAIEYKRLGWKERPDESAADRKLRALIIGLGAYAEEPAIIKEALTRFASCQAGNHTTPNELRAIIFTVAVKEKASGAFEYLMDLHDRTTNSDLKTDIMAALTATKDTSEAKRLLDRLQDASLVRPQDADYWLIYLLRNRYVRTAAWDWMVVNWQWIVATYAHDKSYDNFPRYAASVCNTPAWAGKYADFFGPKEGEIALKRNIQIGLAEIDTRVRWLQRDLPAMQRFFISANH